MEIKFKLPLFLMENINYTFAFLSVKYSIKTNTLTPLFHLHKKNKKIFFKIKMNYIIYTII
jgi:hypothetical protein